MRDLESAMAALLLSLAHSHTHISSCPRSSTHTHIHTLLVAHHAITSASCVMKRKAMIMMIPCDPTCASPILLEWGLVVCR